jgi:hypothetical protein
LLLSGGYWIARSSRAMTVTFRDDLIGRLDSGFALARAPE